MDSGLIFVIILGVAAVVGLIIQQENERQNAKQKTFEEENRLRRVREKYKNSSYADDIARGLVRQGMTYEMVVDAWGEPAGIDRKVYKTKTKEVLKYNPGPRRTYGNRVTLEDGIVVGWDSR